MRISEFKRRDSIVFRHITASKAEAISLVSALTHQLATGSGDDFFGESDDGAEHFQIGVWEPNDG